MEKLLPRPHFCAFRISIFSFLFVELISDSKSTAMPNQRAKGEGSKKQITNEVVTREYTVNLVLTPIAIVKTVQHKWLVSSHRSMPLVLVIILVSSNNEHIKIWSLVWNNRCKVSRVSFHLPIGIEIDNLAAIQKYHQLNGTLPAKIIVYRDGVNDFQLLDVIDSELPALNDLCSKLQEGYE